MVKSSLRMTRYFWLVATLMFPIATLHAERIDWVKENEKQAALWAEANKISDLLFEINDRRSKWNTELMELYEKGRTKEFEALKSRGELYEAVEEDFRDIYGASITLVHSLAMANDLLKIKPKSQWTQIRWNMDNICEHMPSKLGWRYSSQRGSNWDDGFLLNHWAKEAKLTTNEKSELSTIIVTLKKLGAYYGRLCQQVNIETNWR